MRVTLWSQPPTKSLLRGLFIVCVVIALLGGPVPASATTFAVNNPADEPDISVADGVCLTAGGACTLRAAIQQANGADSADRIELPADTYTIDGSGDDDAAVGDLDVKHPLAIAGSGIGATIDAQDNGRVLEVRPGAERLTLENLKLTGGRAVDGSAVFAHAAIELDGVEVTGNESGGPMGSAVVDGEELCEEITIRDSYIHHNSTGGAGNGFGVVDFNPAATGAMTFDSSVLAYNDVGLGGYGRGGLRFLPAAGGSLTVRNSEFIGNTAGKGTPGNSSSGYGGAIDFTPLDTSTLNVSGSSFIDNQAGGGGAYGVGGAINFAHGPDNEMAIVNSTFTGNQAGGGGGDGHGGAIKADPKIGDPPTWYDSTSRVVNTTIANNHAFGTWGVGGGWDAAGGTLEIANSIIYGNSSNTDPNCYPGDPGRGDVTSLGSNIIGSEDDCSFGGPGDVIGVDPLIAPSAADNGGPTKSLALLDGSPAIDSGDNTLCPTTDQRGIARPQPVGGRCDIGAFEREQPPPPDPAVPASQTAGAVVDPPVANSLSLRSLGITPRAFSARKRGPSIASRGALVSLVVNRAATVVFRVERRAARSRGWKRLGGSFQLACTSGLNSFRFTGRLRNRPLRSGSYRLIARAKTALPKSPEQVAGFQIKPRGNR